MNSTLKYSLARLGLFAACLGLFWLVGLKDLLWLLLAAATVSMLLSLFLLAGMRERMSADIAARAARSVREPRPTRAAHEPSDEEVEDSYR